MKLYKIIALIYADMLLLKNSKWRLIEYIYFPVTTIIIWGLFSTFLSEFAAEAGMVVLIVNVLWNFGQLTQQHVNMQINEDSWSGSMKQIFVAGVSDLDYLIARILGSVITSIPLALLLVVLSIFMFDISIFVTQWKLFSFLLMTTMLSSIGLAILVAAMMIAFGREYGFLAWTALQAFVLFSAPFYPVSVYPEAMQSFVYIMPFTSTFEATRAAIANTVTQEMLVNALVISLAYIALSLPIYRHVFKKALERGWITRLS